MSDRVAFGPFELDIRAGQLRKHGVTLKLSGQPVEVLMLLLAHPGELVTREELRQRLWRDETFVDFEHGLNAAVNKLRFALGDSADRPRYIETVPRRGYRFIGSAPSPAVESAGAPRGEADGTVSGTPTPRPHASAPAGAWSRVSRGGWVSVAGFAAVALVVGISSWIGGSNASHVSASRTRLVVLPFENLSGDPDQDYFATGLTDEMITLLGQLDPQRLGVVARTSAAFYGGSRRRARDIARDLDVDYIVEGSVRLDGRRVRASVQLIRAADEAHVWTDSYDRDLQDLLDVQHELARAIADRVELTVPPLASRSRRTATRPTPEAYEAYLRGRYLLERRTADALARGHAYLQEAVRLDPQFALGYAALSRGYHRLAGETVPAQEAMPRAAEASDHSLQLNPDLAEGHAARAMVFASYTWDWVAAERAFRRALDLGPQSVETRIAYASFLSHVGRLDEAVAEAERALQLDPVSLSGRAQLAVILYRARRYADALEQLEGVRELDSNFPTTYLNLALVHAARAQHREALAAIEKGRTLDPESVDLMSIHAYVLGRAGERDRAAAVLDALASRAIRQYVHPWTIGLVHLGLGDNTAALDALERGFEQRSWMTTLIKVNPELDPLRGDPRFERLIERMRFP